MFRGTSRSEHRSFTLSVIAKRARSLPLSVIGDPTGVCSVDKSYTEGGAVGGVVSGGMSLLRLSQTEMV